MPAARAQTTKQAKASYKNSTGAPRLTERERKQFERNIVLQDRADKEQERESRRQWAIKQKAKREEKERELRQQAGMGLATQLAGYSHTQKRMKSAMEGFLTRSKVKIMQEESATDKEVMDSVGDPYIEEVEVDTVVLGQELSKQRVADAGVRASASLAGTPKESPATTPRTRGPFRASQSFGDGLDDESLIEAESQSAKTITVIKVSPPRPLKRSRDNITEEHTGAIKPFTIAPPEKQRRLRAEAHAPPNSRTQTATSAIFSAASASSIKPQSLDACIFNASEQEMQVRTARSVSRIPEPMLGLDLDDLFPSNTQVAHELTPPKFVPSMTSLGVTQAHARAWPSGKHAVLTISSPCDEPSIYTANVPSVPAKRADGGFSMPPPPRPTPLEPKPRRSPKRDAERRVSAFGDFGLSTQLVHAVIEEDLELSDDDSVGSSQDPGCRGGGPNLLKRETMLFTADDIEFDD